MVSSVSIVSAVDNKNHSSTSHISSLHIETNINDRNAKGALYTYIDKNLDNNSYVYLGYSLTNDFNEAITITVTNCYNQRRIWSEKTQI